MIIKLTAHYMVGKEVTTQPILCNLNSVLEISGSVMESETAKSRIVYRLCKGDTVFATEVSESIEEIEAMIGTDDDYDWN